MLHIIVPYDNIVARPILGHACAKSVEIAVVENLELGVHSERNKVVGNDIVRYETAGVVQIIVVVYFQSARIVNVHKRIIPHSILFCWLMVDLLCVVSIKYPDISEIVVVE